MLLFLSIWCIIIIINIINIIIILSSMNKTNILNILSTWALENFGKWEKVVLLILVSRYFADSH